MPEELQYWRSLEEREAGVPASEAGGAEFASTPLSIIEPDAGRRAFLKAAGFTFAGAFLAGCSRAPEQKAMPHLVQPEGAIAGRPIYYASTCGACTAGCGILVKTRDGRPIKLEGNPRHPLSRGGLCAVGQASILGLYDSLRLKHPILRGKQASWEEADREVAARLDAIRQRGGAVRFLSHSVTSPTTLSAIGRFLAGFKDSRHVAYDALSSSAILDAHQVTHGTRILPHYRFENADVIVSFDADFLGTWISPVEFTRAHSESRNPEHRGSRPVSYHIQIESRLSVTGSKAGRRIRIAPEETVPRLRALLTAVVTGDRADAVASRLLAARGRSLVVCGTQDVEAQTLVNRINQELGNYGSTLDIARPSRQRQGNDGELHSLLDEIAANKVSALFLHGVNPVYDLPDGAALAAQLEKLPLVVSFTERVDETASKAHVVCPVPHFLETWSDAEPVAGIVSIGQPAIQPLSEARTVAESLSAWTGSPRSARDLVREQWQGRLNWEDGLREGFARVDRKEFPSRWIAGAANPAPRQQEATPDGLHLVLYPKPSMLDGRHAYNPWLQELPDPITKATWDNYASIAPALAQTLDVRDGDILRLERNGRTLELPAVIQPGQHERVVAVALGYGRTETARFSSVGPRWFSAGSSTGENGLVGKNAAHLASFAGGVLQFESGGLQVKKTGKRQELAITQSHHTVAPPPNLAPASGGVRPIVQETTLEALAHDEPHAHAAHGDLWPPDHAYHGRHWGMAVDLNACTGCSACVIACQVENNIPVVGRDEVRRKREMHWIRIDRYYSGDGEDVTVAHQPMMCQHCEHAGCETVCPVLATVHSSEGLNQQIYNRCVGTRYCANNCAYKTRRFNWFDYPREDKLANMVLNPDVTVRSRGVMEKCTFCVQRIQDAKFEAKRRGEALRDGDFETACQQSCPARAIAFGDKNDPESAVSRLVRGNREYTVLEEINLKPSVHYLKLVRPTGVEEERHG